MNKHRNALLVTTLLAQALAMQIASAQATSKPDQDLKTLDNIVVTATKRAETAQTVPISMTAVSGAELERRGVGSLSDLARIAPSLSVTSSGPGSNNLVIRGISSSAGSAATVGYYLDDVPISASSNAALLSTRGVIDPALFDVERVEVLRGPQGAIYGSSSMGGTIKQVCVGPAGHRVLRRQGEAGCLQYPHRRLQWQPQRLGQHPDQEGRDGPAGIGLYPL